KDAFHRLLCDGAGEAVNPERVGTKAALHYFYPDVPPGRSVVLRLRFTEQNSVAPLDQVDQVVRERRQEADEFYAAIHPRGASEDEKRVQRQALAGLLWTKQSYIFDVHEWMDGDCSLWPPSPSRRKIRNQHWLHLNSLRVMTMPDKW